MFSDQGAAPEDDTPVEDDRPTGESNEPSSPADDAGEAEVQATADAEAEVGYRGNKADPRPNEDYSLESGPDAPALVDTAEDALNLRVEANRAAAAE